MAITHGCIRMYPEDIEALFPLVPVNTPVWLINEPVKVARVNGQVWLEVHPPVDAEGQRAAVDLEGFYALANAALGETPAAIHWDFVLATLQEARACRRWSVSKSKRTQCRQPPPPPLHEVVPQEGAPAMRNRLPRPSRRLPPEPAAPAAEPDSPDASGRAAAAN